MTVLILEGEEANALIQYLETHEDDIALRMDDFGELRGIFKVVMAKFPVKHLQVVK